MPRWKPSSSCSERWLTTAKSEFSSGITFSLSWGMIVTDNLNNHCGQSSQVTGIWKLLSLESPCISPFVSVCLETQPEQQVCMKPFCIAVQSAAMCHACLPPVLHPLGQKAKMLMTHVCFGSLRLGFLLRPLLWAGCLLTHGWDTWDLPELLHAFPCSCWHLLAEQSQLVHLQKVA